MNLHSFSKHHIKVIEEAKLADYTTFRLGGPCKGLIDAQTPEELIEAVKHLAEEGHEYILIGGGSNLVVSDAGLNCYVIRYASTSTLIDRKDAALAVSAATSLDDLALYAAENGLEGINYCSGIPGTVGGAVVGNAGAFGKQIGDVLEQATLLSRQGKLKRVKQKHLGLSYRHSNLKKSDDIVVDVTLKLKAGDKQVLLEEREGFLKLRRQKHPDLSKEPCAGSFFRNVEATSSADIRQAAGWFLDQAGAKALTHGGAYVFDKHANIIIKGEGTSAQDVYELSQKMSTLIKNVYNLDLVREVRFVGKIPGMPNEVETLIW
jgi:UDP-N-acetylmuramate dehydrogenase